MMEYNIGSGSSSDVRQCVEEATRSFRQPKLILFFSPVDKFAEYAALIHEKFPTSVSLGATTIASLSKGGAAKRDLCTVGFENGIKCSADVLEDIDKYPIRYAERVKKCVDEVRETRNTICLAFTTALLCAEESVLAALNSVLFKYDIPVFGGTAGDMGNASGTMVAMNGRIREKSAVFAVIHNEGGAIKVFRENIYRPITGNVLTATKVDRRSRTVLEYNNQPAAHVFARELGVAEHELASYLDTNPIARLVGDEQYITANCSISAQAAITYHARVYENSKVMVLKPADYRDIMQETIAKIHNDMPRTSFSLMCHCLARSILFEGDRFLNEYAQIMGQALGNYVGFSGYGEQTGEQHFNQTMTVAVFS